MRPSSGFRSNKKKVAELGIYTSYYYYSSMALQPLWALAAFQFPNLYTVGRTPWTSDQPVARPLPTQDNPNTE
jgi:hypothetical protein